MKKTISIIIPVYNEEKELESTLQKVNSVVNKLFDDYELLIFDDCSTDKSGEILDNIARLNPTKIRIKIPTKMYTLFFIHQISA